MSKEIITMEDTIKIPPEMLEVANAYLQMGLDTQKTAMMVGIPSHEVAAILKNSHVSSYVSSIMLEQGYMNRGKLYDLMNTIIEKKLEECEESEMYSSKDILEVLESMHKMRMDEIKAQQRTLELEAKANKGPSSVTVAQVNNGVAAPNSNLGALLGSLIKKN